MNKTILRIPVDRIDVGARLRPVDAAWVELLAASLAERGQDTPITVRPAEEAGRYILVAGGHRVAAADIAGIEALDAFVTEASDDEATLAEIDENLMRRELSPLDRAVFLAARKEVYLRLFPTAAHGKAKKNKGKEKTTSLSSFPIAFAKATASRLGLDPRSIQRAIARASISPEVRAMIAGHAVAESGAELDKLAKLTPARQRDVAIRLTRDEKPLRSVGSALAEITGPVEISRAAQQSFEFQRLLEAWRKAGRPARRQFLEHMEFEGEIAPQAKEIAA